MQTANSSAMMVPFPNGARISFVPPNSVRHWGATVTKTHRRTIEMMYNLKSSFYPCLLISKHGPVFYMYLTPDSFANLLYPRPTCRWVVQHAMHKYIHDYAFLWNLLLLLLLFQKPPATLTQPSRALPCSTNRHSPGEQQQQNYPVVL